jgi:hypothetical protein
MNKKPKALLIAEELEFFSGIDLNPAAAELRRLHELNAEMLNALYAVELWLSSGEGTGFQEKVLAAINKAEGRVMHNLNKAAEANGEPL